MISHPQVMDPEEVVVFHGVAVYQALDYFSMNAFTNYHEYNSLKQYKFIVLEVKSLTQVSLD